jgi:hypothetical protein
VIVHIITFLLRDEKDLIIANNCFGSLEKTPDTCVVLYNQGYMTNAQMKKYLEKFQMEFHVLGRGCNEGIAKARQACIEYVWENLPECRYIAELHVDMLFPPDWHKPLVEYLKTHDEPIISPGIVTQYGEIQPLKKNVKSLNILEEPESIIKICQNLREDKICEGFVSPVVFKNSVLQQLGGYDTRFLKGKQAYEDDSILLGFRYYMGLRYNWKPKCCLASYVYHATLAQRMSLKHSPEDFMVNLNGLFKQYGAYGFLQLAEIHGNAEFIGLANSVIGS